MSKTKEELNALKEEVNSVNEKLHELTPEELEQVTSGIMPGICSSWIHQLAPGLKDHSVPELPDFVAPIPTPNIYQSTIPVKRVDK